MHSFFFNFSSKCRISLALFISHENGFSIKTNKITQGYAKILVGLANSDQIAKKIIKKNLSVRQTENLVRLYKLPSKSIKSTKDPNIKKIENDLMEKIGLKTQISNKKNNKGSVTFDYRDLDQLNRLIEIIKKYY